MKTQQDSTGRSFVECVAAIFLILSHPWLEAPKWAKPPRFRLVPFQHWVTPGCPRASLKVSLRDTNPFIPGELQINSMERPACCWAVSIQYHELLGIAWWDQIPIGTGTTTKEANWPDSFFRSGLHSSTGPWVGKRSINFWYLDVLRHLGLDFNMLP